MKLSLIRIMSESDTEAATSYTNPIPSLKISYDYAQLAVSFVSSGG
jgi:hypothetical protein